MRRAAFAAGAVLTVLLAACSSGSDAGSAGAASPSPSPTPTPTPSSVVWAGDVCEARDNVKASVAALGRNLSYDVTADASALDQIDRQLRIQVLSVGNALDGLKTALAGVPVDFAAANDLVVTSTKALDDTKGAVTTATEHLDAMVNADNVVTGVAEAGQALVAAKAAYEAGSVLVSTVAGAASTASADLQEAFDAAPECQASASEG